MLRVKHVYGAAAIILLPLLLFACAPAPGEEPVASVQNDEKSEASVSALSAVTVDDDSPDENSSNVDDSESEQSPDEPASPAPAEGDGETTVGEPVEPVEVDLGRVTSVPPPVGGEAVVQPQPGSPDTAKVMAHKASMNLAERIGVDVGDVKVVSVEEVEWRDSSLGCPKPNMSYLMVITPGFRVVLEAEGKTYEYHTDMNQHVVLCEGPPAGFAPAPPVDQ